MYAYGLGIQCAIIDTIIIIQIEDLQYTLYTDSELKPTNGICGIVPAVVVLSLYCLYIPDLSKIRTCS